MMRSSFNRRTATKVKSGKIQRKNRNRPTGHDGYILDRESPGRGFRHVVTKRQVQSFIDTIPEWDKFSERLERIVLPSRSERCDGLYLFYHREETGAIFLHAWPEDLWMELAPAYFKAHEDILLRLRVAVEIADARIVCRFTEDQARAFTLLHVFMHELGHHYDAIHQKHRGGTKGEDYAERFANSHFDKLFPEYIRVFGHPGEGI